ncbi:Putative transcriptional regulator, partial [Salmonella enterica subsp. enterica serovar Heidelberg str. 670102-3]
MANWAQKLKLHHLQTLVALGEQGNLTHVARMMNISQPALSKWLSQLEDEIGITLFERHSKGLRPSEGGKLLLQHAQRLINDLERSQYEIARFKQGGLVGSLKIGCSPVATDCVSQAILSLLNEMPTLHLNIEEKVMTPLLHDLLAGQVDVVVGRVGGRALQLPLNYQVLYTEPVCFVARPHHPLAARAQIAWSDLAHWRWIVWPTGTPIRISIDNALVDNGVMLPENTIESASMNVSTNLLQSSDMISILSLRLA